MMINMSNKIPVYSLAYFTFIKGIKLSINLKKFVSIKNV
jgi:hypothetical protein